MELKGSASSLEYRTMYLRLQIKHGLFTSRETVCQILRIVNPEGVEKKIQTQVEKATIQGKGCIIHGTLMDTIS